MHANDRFLWELEQFDRIDRAARKAVLRSQRTASEPTDFMFWTRELLRAGGAS